MNLDALLDEVKTVIGAIPVTLDPGEPLILLQRRFIATADLAALKRMNVDVLPGGVELDLATRSETQSDQKVGISIRQKLPPNVNPDEEAANVWIGARLARVGAIVKEIASLHFDEAQLTNIDNVPLFDANALTKDGMFASMITLTFTDIS